MSKPMIASDPMYDAFIREVKKRIAQKGYTQAQVAAKIGMKPCNFNLALNRHWFFRPVCVFRLAKLLKIKLDWITEVTPPSCAAEEFGETRRRRGDQYAGCRLRERQDAVFAL